MVVEGVSVHLCGILINSIVIPYVMVWKNGGVDLELEISRGESNRLEFKKELTDDHKKYLKTVVAFSNGSGGKILFGVADDRSIVGIADDVLFSTVDSITRSIVA